MIILNKNSCFVQCGGGWPENIGNAFIDYGVKYILTKALGGASGQIHCTSNATNWIYNRYGSEKNYFNIASKMRPDFFVFGGSMLDVDWFTSHESIYNNLVNSKTKVILLGIGGGDKYHENEISAMRERLSKLNIFTFISRDETAYRCYHDLADHSYNGIDCAFFLNDAFTPIHMDFGDYVVFNFDKMNSPNITVKEKILKIHHEPWKFAHNRIFSWWDFKKFVWNFIHRQHNIISKNNFFSDIPDDYLNIYANCKVTYSDRIHACVATVSFGNSARLFTDSSRSLLFERVGIGNIKEKLVSLDKKAIDFEKGKEIKFLTEVLSKN